MSPETVLCAPLALRQPLELGSGESASPCPPEGTIWGRSVGDSGSRRAAERRGQAGGAAAAEAQPGAFRSRPREVRRAPGLPRLSALRVRAAGGRAGALGLPWALPRVSAPRRCPPPSPCPGKRSPPGPSASRRQRGRAEPRRRSSPRGCLPSAPARARGRPAGALRCPHVGRERPRVPGACFDSAFPHCAAEG